MKSLFIATSAVLFFSLGTLSAADPVPAKVRPKCACTGEVVCKCDKAKKCKCTEQPKPAEPKKQEPIKNPTSQSIIKRVTNPVLDKQKQRDQNLVDQGLL